MPGPRCQLISSCLLRIVMYNILELSEVGRPVADMNASIASAIW